MKAMPIIYKMRSKLPAEMKKKIKLVLKKVLKYIPITRSLHTLSLKYGTDKFGHGYLQHYEKYFSPIRNKKLNILEIGIGGFDDPKNGGDSLRMFQDYFPKSIIYGIDLYDKRFCEDKRIKTFKGSQNDPEFLKYVANNIQSIDIIGSSYEFVGTNEF